LREAEDLKSAADEAARFWRERLSKKFPSFEKGFDEEGLIDGVKKAGDKGEAVSPAEVLSRAAVVNLASRASNCSEEELHLRRLAALTMDLSQQEPLRSFLRSNIPGAIERISRVRSLLAEPRGEAYLVVCAAKGIKSYIFETPGLNEIRGASTLLDELVEELAGKAAESIGPEAVLRCAASTVELLAPSPYFDDQLSWADLFKRRAYEKLKYVQVAAASQKARIADLIERFSRTLGKAHLAMEADRFYDELPLLETLPFEQRCALCRTRPAERWETIRGEETAVCEACFVKFVRGRSERRSKLGEALELVGLTPEAIGVEGETAEQCTADLISDMIPKGVRRRLMAVAYGDGNNFGAALKGMRTIADYLSWSFRVSQTVKLAASIALARSTQIGARSMGWLPGKTGPKLKKLPFQILALGGDDLSLICWGRIGLHFCETFLRLTDMEFAPQYAFSLGMLICDEKTPVRRAVEFAEGELLKWAKRAFRGMRPERRRGTMTFLLADSPERIPPDLEGFRERMFSIGSSLKTYMTLRPFTADELRFLLEKADELREHRGRLYRLAQAFIASRSALVGALHYAYQKGRTIEKGFFETLEGPNGAGSWEEIFRIKFLPIHKLDRPPFGEGEGKGIYCPVWDLVEICKAME